MPRLGYYARCFKVFRSLEDFGLAGLTGSDEVGKFLSVLKAGTRGVNSAGLKLFRQYYSSRFFLGDFLKNVKHNGFLIRHAKRRKATETLDDFAAWLQDYRYAPKTVRVYIGAVQSLAKYYDIPINLRYGNLPTAIPVNRKHPWTLAEVDEFVAAMDKPMCRSIAALILQSVPSMNCCRASSAFPVYASPCRVCSLHGWSIVPPLWVRYSLTRRKDAKWMSPIR